MLKRPGGGCGFYSHTAHRINHLRTLFRCLHRLLLYAQNLVDCLIGALALQASLLLWAFTASTS
jgi:hypothetical protein